MLLWVLMWNGLPLDSVPGSSGGVKTGRGQEGRQGWSSLCLGQGSEKGVGPRWGGHSGLCLQYNSGVGVEQSPCGDEGSSPILLGGNGFLLAGVYISNLPTVISHGKQQKLKW